MKHVPIEIDITAANCPFCGAYSSITWGVLASTIGERHVITYIEGFKSGRCHHCNNSSIWYNTESDNYVMVYPISGDVELPNDDMPDDVKIDYLEARNIVNISPRGAAALLRLAIQKLCKHLGESGKNINDDIKTLVQKGLNPLIQKALDSVRVTGNNAVHPGELDLTDDRDTALKIFRFVNVIVSMTISQENQINEFYDSKIPQKDKENILKRDFRK